MAELQTRLKAFEAPHTDQGKVVKQIKKGHQALSKDQLNAHLFANSRALISALVAEPEKAEPYFNLGLLPATPRKKHQTATVVV